MAFLFLFLTLVAHWEAAAAKYQLFVNERAVPMYDDIAKRIENGSFEFFTHELFIEELFDSHRDLFYSYGLNDSLLNFDDVEDCVHIDDVDHHIEQLPDQGEFRPFRRVQPLKFARFHLQPFRERLLLLAGRIQVPLKRLGWCKVWPGLRGHCQRLRCGHVVITPCCSS